MMQSDISTPPSTSSWPAGIAEVRWADGYSYCLNGRRYCGTLDALKTCLKLSSPNCLHGSALDNRNHRRVSDWQDRLHQDMRIT